MIEIKKSAVINRPVEEVFAYVADVENAIFGPNLCQLQQLA